MTTLGKPQVEALVHDLRNEVNVIGFACSALRLQIRDGDAAAKRSLDRLEAAYARCTELLVSFQRETDGNDSPPAP